MKFASRAEATEGKHSEQREREIEKNYCYCCWWQRAAIDAENRLSNTVIEAVKAATTIAVATTNNFMEYACELSTNCQKAGRKRRCHCLLSLPAARCTLLTLPAASNGHLLLISLSAHYVMLFDCILIAAAFPFCHFPLCILRLSCLPPLCIVYLFNYLRWFSYMLSACCSLLLMISLPCLSRSCPASFLRAGLMLSSNRRSQAQSGHSYWFRRRFRSRLHPVGASTCAFPTVKQDLVLGSSGRHEHIQHTWQLMLNANVYIATWNLNVQLVRPNRLFLGPASIQSSSAESRLKGSRSLLSLDPLEN